MATRLRSFPQSGAGDVIAIAHETIDPLALERAVRSTAAGATVTFLGIVRETSDDGKAVDGLQYEAHESMARETLETIASEARDRFGDVRLAIVHRVGDLAVGEIAVAVVAASAHRAQAFEACRYAIDELKERAPIWKKEHYTGGASAWKDNDGRTAASGG